MTELDFDELDKAVNDLMQDGSTAPAAQGDAQEAHSDNIPSVQNVDVTPESKDPMLSQTTVTPLAVKRRGRFMDVMAPSGINKPVIDGFIKRQGVTISAPSAPVTPNDDVRPTENTAGEPLDVMPVSVPAENNVADAGQSNEAEQHDNQPYGADGNEYAANPAPVNEWPEPQEVTNVEESEQMSHEVPVESNDDTVEAHVNEWPAEQDGAEGLEAEVAESKLAPEMAAGMDHTEQQLHGDNEQLTTVITPDDTRADDQADESDMPVSQDTVMNSPFLPDAKVEKRPLGGSDTQATEVEGPAAVAAPVLPRELNNDVMSLDADVNIASEKRDDEPVQAVALVTPSITPQQPTATQAASAATAALPVAGAIFDTNTYHTPLKQPAKAKNPWLTAIWIIVLLIVGCIAGAAYYYFTMPQ